MLNLLRKFLRPTLREQLEDGVREALKRYTERRAAPDLRVYVSTDLLPEGMGHSLWTRDEAEHLRRFAAQWAQDNGIFRAGLRVEVILLDTKRQFAFVKPLGLDGAESGAAAAGVTEGRRLVREGPHEGAVEVAGAAGKAALLEVVSAPGVRGPLRVTSEVIYGRRGSEDVVGLEDRYMSARHARLQLSNGRLWVIDLDSKNRTYVNDEPLTPHQPHPLAVGDALRMGTTTLRVSHIDA
jgi:hypothetical protein